MKTNTLLLIGGGGLLLYWLYTQSQAQAAQQAANLALMPATANANNNAALINAASNFAQSINGVFQ
jgi:hypothetical protein